MKRSYERGDGAAGATRRWPAAIDAKRWSDNRAASLIAALVAAVVSVLLYRASPDLGFAAVCMASAAAGWLLSRRMVELACLAVAGAVAASVWSAGLPVSAAALQLAVALSIAALAHLAAQGVVARRINAENERRLQGVTFLLETAEFLAGARDQDEILTTAVRASARGISKIGNTGSAHAAFHEVSGDQARIAVVSDEPRHQVLATGFEYPLARNQAALAAIRTGRPAIVRPDHLNGTLRTLAEDMGWDVLVMAPVYSGGSIRGLLAATGRDGPAVDHWQQFMLARLARFTSASLDSAATRHAPLPAAAAASDERFHARVLDGHLEQGLEGGAEVALGGPDKLGELITRLTAQAAIDEGTGLLNREHGLAALEHDMRRSQRTRSRAQCLAVLRMPASRDRNTGGEHIRLVVDRLRSQLRRDDLIFRYADDEIVCWFGEIDAADVQTILNRVQSDIAREIGHLPFAIGLTSLEPARSAS